MPPVEMHRVRMRPEIAEINLDAVALGRSNGWSWHLAVVRPGGEEYAGSNLNLTVRGNDVVLAQQRPVRTRRFSINPRALVDGKLRKVPASKVGRRIENVGRHPPDRTHRMVLVR